MSGGWLLNSQFEDFVIIDKTTQPDGYGGVETVWTEGAIVQAAASWDDSTGAQIAQALTEVKTYTIVTQKNVIFRFGDVVKRVRDGKYFLIKSDADDTQTPNGAPLDMRQCSAVEWTLPGEITPPAPTPTPGD